MERDSNAEINARNDRAAGMLFPRDVPFDREQLRRQDVGNILELGHANMWIGDAQRSATAFYVQGLGLTRDPYILTGLEVMWVNVGRSQFHLPCRAPAQVLRGTIGLVVPDLALVRRSLAVAALYLHDTKFAVEDHDSFLLATCPFGNRFRVHQHDPDSFGRPRLGMPYIEFPVAHGAAQRVARFYREMLGAHTWMGDTRGRLSAHIRTGPWQEMIFVEADGTPLPYDQHHVMITLADFSGPYFRLRERGLITLEDNRWQWRFEDIVDLDTGEVLFKIEHEVRSMQHPQYGRPLINREPTRNPIEFVGYGEDLQIYGPAASS